MTIALVNDARVGNNAGTTSQAITIPSTTAGNLLVCVVGTKDAADIVSSITGGGTWTQVKDTGGAEGASQQTEVWICPDVAGGVTSVTVSTAGSTRIVIWVGEFSGAATADVKDTGTSASSAAIGTSTTPAPGSFTPSQTNGLAIMATQFANTNTTISNRPTGFTAPANGNVESGAASASGVELDVVYKIDPGTSAIVEDWTISASLAWGAVSVVLKEASGASPLAGTGLPGSGQTRGVAAVGALGAVSAGYGGQVEVAGVTASAALGALSDALPGAVFVGGVTAVGAVISTKVNTCEGMPIGSVTGGNQNSEGTSGDALSFTRGATATTLGTDTVGEVIYGAKSLELNGPASEFCYAYWLWGGVEAVSGRCAIRIPSIPSTAVDLVSIVQSGSATKAMSIRIGSDGRLNVKNAADGTPFTTTGALTAGVYQIAIAVQPGNSTGNGKASFAVYDKAGQFVAGMTEPWESTAFNAGTNLLSPIYFGKITAATWAPSLHVDQMTSTNQYALPAPYTEPLLADGLPGGVSVGGVTAAASGLAEAADYELRNTFGGITSGTAVTTGNSGGSSGDAFTAVVGTVTAEDSAALTAPYPRGAVANVSADTASHVEWTLPQVTNTCYFRRYFRAAALPPATARLLRFTTTDGLTLLGEVRLAATGQFLLTGKAGQVIQQTATGAYAAGTVMRVEVGFTAGTAVLRVYDGESDTPLSVTDVNAYEGDPIGRVRYGVYFLASQTWTTDMAGLGASSHQWIGGANVGLPGGGQVRGVTAAGAIGSLSAALPGAVDVDGVTASAGLGLAGTATPGQLLADGVTAVGVVGLLGTATPGRIFVGGVTAVGAAPLLGSATPGFANVDGVTASAVTGLVGTALPGDVQVGGVSAGYTLGLVGTALPGDVQVGGVRADASVGGSNLGLPGSVSVGGVAAAATFVVTAAALPGDVQVGGVRAVGAFGITNVALPGGGIVDGVTASDVPSLSATGTPGQVFVGGVTAVASSHIVGTATPGGATLEGVAAVGTYALIGAAQPGGGTIDGGASSDVPSLFGTAQPGGGTVGGTVTLSLWPLVAAADSAGVMAAGVTSVGSLGVSGARAEVASPAWSGAEAWNGAEWVTTAEVFNGSAWIPLAPPAP